MRYPFIRPSLPDLERLRKVLAGPWKSGQVTMGDCVREFEEEALNATGVRHAIAVSSCTSGLMLAVRALALKGEIILPSFTFAATAHALVWNGITPVFCDSEPGTLNIDSEKAEGMITKRTSAIMPVAIFGVPPRVDAFRKLGRKHKLRILYDSAQALGAKVDGVCVGGFGDVEVFSLSPTKVVTSIEGGLVTTNDGVLAGRIRQMRDYGKAMDGEDMEYFGLSARMSEIHAAVGLMNLRRMDGMIRHRGKLVGLYRKLLDGLPGVRFQEVPHGVSPTHNYMVIFVDGSGGMTRDKLHGHLERMGIQTKRYFYPAVHEMTAYRRWAKAYAGRLPIAERAARQGLALPLYGDLRMMDVRHICTYIREAFRA